MTIFKTDEGVFIIITPKKNDTNMYPVIKDMEDEPLRHYRINGAPVMTQIGIAHQFNLGRLTTKVCKNIEGVLEFIKNYIWIEQEVI